MSVVFNPFSGKFDFSGDGGDTIIVTIDDANAVVMLEQAIIDGELVIQDEGQTIIKNSLASAFQKITELVTISGNGEMSISSISNLEVNNG